MASSRPSQLETGRSRKKGFFQMRLNPVEDKTPTRNSAKENTLNTLLLTVSSSPCVTLINAPSVPKDRKPPRPVGANPCNGTSSHSSTGITVSDTAAVTATGISSDTTSHTGTTITEPPDIHAEANTEFPKRMRPEASDTDTKYKEVYYTKHNTSQAPGTPPPPSTHKAYKHRSTITERTEAMSKRISFSLDVFSSPGFDLDTRLIEHMPEQKGTTVMDNPRIVSMYQGQYDEMCIDGWAEEDSIEELSEDEDNDEAKIEDEEDEDEVDGIFAKFRRSDPVLNEFSQPTNGRTFARNEGQKRPGDENPTPKYQKVAIEIFTTESTYLRRLGMLTDLEEQLVTSKAMNAKAVKGMFLNLSELHKLHTTLLSKLQQRTANWSTFPHIGDLMMDFSSHLKLYIPFVTCIETTRNTLLNCKPSSKAGSVIAQIQNNGQLGRIPIADFLTEPMFRILRYKLLLGEYLRLLPADHIDRQDTEEALDSITEIAEELNESMRATDNKRQTEKVQESLKETLDLVDPTRIFKKEGRLAMISSENERHLERHLFLFSDRLLVCQPPTMGNKYKLENQLWVSGMKISLDIENQFILTTRNTVIDFMCSTSREAKNWVTEFQNAIQQMREMRQSMNSDVVDFDMEDQDDELGYRAPRLVRMSSSNACRQCHQKFKSIRRPKNHCHACGNLFCSSCSNHDLKLAYNNSQLQRVCDECYLSLQNDGICGSLEDLTSEQWDYDEQKSPIVIINNVKF